MAKLATDITETLTTVVESERQEKIAALAFEFWLASFCGQVTGRAFGQNMGCGAKWERKQEAEQGRTEFAWIWKTY